MSLTKVTYSMIDGAAVSVKDFGAVGDGVANDTSAIQAAINFGNKGVYFPDGTYLINAALTVPSNRTLFGTGTIKLANNAGVNSTNPRVADMLVGTAVSNVTIDGLSFDGNKTNQTVGTAMILFVDDTSVKASNIKITNCNVYNGFISGIGFGGVQSGIVSNCHIYNHNFHGYYSGGGTLLATENVTIIGNTLEDCAGAGIIPMGNGKHTTISGNALYRCGGNGDGITCYDVDNEYVTISGNVVIDSINHGIHAGGRYTSIVGNVVKNSGQAGILFRAQQNGVPAPSSHISISGNTVEKNIESTFLPYSTCIAIRQVSNFAISGNTCHVTGTNEIYGIHVDVSSAGSVSGNTVLGGMFGIKTTGSIRFTLSGNSLYNQNQNAINCANTEQAMIAGNNTYASGLSVGTGNGYALVFDADCDRVNVVGNHFRETSEAFLVSDFGSNNRYSGNFYTDGTTIYDFGGVVAASTINLNPFFDAYIISGSPTSINAITGGWGGRVVTLTFTQNQTLVHGISGDAINFTSGTNYSATPTTVLTIVYRGGYWTASA